MKRRLPVVFAFAMGVFVTLGLTSSDHPFALDSAAITEDQNDESTLPVGEITLEYTEFKVLLGVAYYFGYWTAVSIPEMYNAVATDNDELLQNQCDYLHAKLTWKEDDMHTWLKVYSEEQEFDEFQKYRLVEAYVRTMLAATKESNTTIGLIQQDTSKKVDCVLTSYVCSAPNWIFRHLLY